MMNCEIDLVDIEIADAVQVFPRVAWSVVGSALGLSEATISRRWQRLTSQGLAWISSALHPSATIGAFLEIRVKSEFQGELADALSAYPDVITVTRTTGDSNMFCIVIATSLEGLLQCLHSGLPELVLAEHVKSSLFHQMSGGIAWTQGVVSVSVERRIQESATDPDKSSPMELTWDDRELFLALGLNGRASFQSLAQQLGRSATTIKRRLGQLIQSRAFVFRADVARPIFDQPIAMQVSLKAAPSEAKYVAEKLGNWRETRFCATVADAANVILVVGLHDLASSEQLLARILADFPGIEVVSQKICTKSYKIYGRLLDDYGRVTRSIPVDPWYRLINL